MRGNITVNGKKMTVAELVEAYLETKNDLDTANNLLEARKKEFDSLTMRCIPASVVDFKNHVFGNLVIIPNTKYEDLRNQIKELEAELRVKEDLMTIKNAISNEPTEEHSSRPSIEWYENRYQSDCVTINQLHTTIDVLTDKLANLRKQMGLC